LHVKAFGGRNSLPSAFAGIKRMFIDRNSKVMVLTGAGISAESGLKTFREPGGMWDTYDWRELATPAAFEKSPEKVWEFYMERRRQIRDAQPNEAHKALVRLEKHMNPGRFLLVSQNVDDLHERAGQKNIIKIHGSAMRDICASCGSVLDSADSYNEFPPRHACGGLLRPDVVWFGEPLNSRDLKTAMDWLLSCDYFIVIGTSGNVFPVAQFVYQTEATKIYIGLEEPENSRGFQQVKLGKAGIVLPELIEELCEV